MKSYNQHQKITFLFIITAFAAILPSCKKSKMTNGGGTSVTEISEVRTEGKIRLVSLDFTPGNQSIIALTLKNQSTGSNSSVHIKLSSDNAAVTASSLMPLPAASYTMPTLEYDIPANGTVSIPLTINKSHLTVDTTYGISFKITQVSSGTISNDAKDIVVKIGLRNRWDGRYKATGTLTDFSDAAYSFPEQEILVITTGASQVKVVPKQLGIPGYLALNHANLTYYSSFGPVLNMDAATNKISSVVNFYGQPAANTRSAQLDPSGTNSWDPGTKNMMIKFWMNQPSVINQHRVAYNNNWIYLGPR